MKTSYLKRGSWLLAMFVIFNATAWALPGAEDEAADTINYTSYYGTVVDGETSRTLPFATVEAQGSNVATVTNIDGEFQIKIEKGLQITGFKISYIGYTSRIIPVEEFRDERSLSIRLEPSAVALKEITVRPQDAADLIAVVLQNIHTNYSSDPMMMRAFYRETIERGRNYVSISEAVVDIYKGAYTNEFQVDQVKIFKGRKSADVEKMDTVLFKLQGGPSTTILLDVVKNPYILLSTDYIDIYDFQITDVITIDNRLHYVVSFAQRFFVEEPFYRGKFYIDMEKLAITEAEFELNTTNQDEAAKMFIQKKPLTMTIIPERAAYRAKYTIEDDHWYFTYARAEVKFKVDWKKKLFNTTYNTMSEIAITDRTFEGIERFAARERFKRNDVMDEKVYIFFDQGFWEGYNVIEPDQSIESAIRRLNRIYLRRSEG